MISPNYKLVERQSEPVNFITFDNLISDELAQTLYDEILTIPQIELDYAWGGEANNSVKKFYINDYSKFSNEKILSVLNWFNSMHCMSHLNRFMPLGNLIPDPLFNGGGIHITYPGGTLRFHTDFTTPKMFNTKLKRISNLLIYLTPDYYSTNSGGELCFRNGNGEIYHSIELKQSRAVYFETNSTSVHGHPTPVQGEKPRVSIAFYYYVSPDDEFDVTRGATWL